MLTVDEKTMSITDGNKVLPYKSDKSDVKIIDIEDCIHEVTCILEDFYEDYYDGYEDEQECPAELRNILLEVNEIFASEYARYTDAEKIDLMNTIVNMCNKEKIHNIFDYEYLVKRGNIIHEAIASWLNTKHGVNLFDNQYL